MDSSRPCIIQHCSVIQKHTAPQLDSGPRLTTISRIGNPPRVIIRKFFGTQTCTVCSSEFASKTELRRHQRAHHETVARNHHCPVCRKSFTTANYLAQHMRIHSKLKPYGPCDACGKSFTQQSHLQQHVRTHTGEKPYKCTYPGCGKEFAQLSNVRNHSRVHEEDKPFKCNSCYKSFDTEWDLLKHIPTHKKTKSLRVHICPFCGKSYSLVTYLIKHVEEKHAPAQSLRRVVRSKVQENEITSTMNSDNSTMDSMEDSIGSSLPTSPTLSSNSEDGSRSQRLDSADSATIIRSLSQIRPPTMKSVIAFAPKLPPAIPAKYSDGRATPYVPWFPQFQARFQSLKLPIIGSNLY